MKNVLAVLSTRKAIVFITAALLLVVATGWASTGGSLEVVAGNGHYSLQPIW
jgi:hypothetical protein